jgi:hypothetical protein
MMWKPKHGSIRQLIASACLALFATLATGCAYDDDGEADTDSASAEPVSCVVDTQCKGDRLCLGGVCADPPATTDGGDGSDTGPAVGEETDATTTGASDSGPGETTSAESSGDTGESGDATDGAGDTGATSDPFACPVPATSCADDETLISGVCVKTPTRDALIDDDGRGGGGKAPNLDCIDAPFVEPPGPDETHYEGCISAFGLDANTFNGCTVEVYRSEAGTLVGPVLDVMTAVEVPRDRCNNRGLVRSNKKLPTNTLLVFKASCTGFQDTYTFNRYFPADARQPAPKGSAFTGYIIWGGEYDVNIIASSSWTLRTFDMCPATGEGFGAIAGAIRDCERANISGATFGITGPYEFLQYFEGTVPGPNRKDTDASATYSVCNPPIGRTRISAAVKVGGAIRSLGAWDVSVFSQSVTILTFGGKRPLTQTVCR